MKIVNFALSAAVLCTAQAHADLGEQLFKFLPSDGAETDLFGNAVAISGDIAVIGAPQNDDNSSNSGSAYLFNALTGQQLFKLLPDDGAFHDAFGFSVAINNNTVIIGAVADSVGAATNGGSAYIFNTLGAQLFKLVADDADDLDNFGTSVGISGSAAIVGSVNDDDNGDDSGSAYLFDANSGQQLFKLLADDGQEFDDFGFAVAISGTIAIVGAQFDDDNGSNAGSAYLFNTTTGQQLFKLLADDGTTDDQFGVSVAISGTTAIIGALGNDDNGENSGSTYLFNTTTGQQIAKLLPSDGAASDEFGNSVAINGTTAIIGAWRENALGFFTGTAYIFDTITGNQLSQIISDDSAQGDAFGWSVGISTTAIVGAFHDDDNDFNSGAAYLFTFDTDRDGLRDDWEINGIPYLDQHFILPGADPMHKDLFIEVDAMAGQGLSDGAVAFLEAAFADAPLTNPDGVDGVTLHILRDETNLPFVELWETDGCWPLDFDQVRSDHFGLVIEDEVELLEAKAKAYRYCVVANKAEPINMAGCAEVFGDNMVIFLGIGDLDNLQQATIFMHEFGHNLGLEHGGDDEINGKTNYPSIMNYVLSFKFNWNAAFWKLDYSRANSGDFVILDESSLNEIAGIGTPKSFYSGYKMPYGVNELDAQDKTIRVIKYAKLDGTPTDFGDVAGSMFQDEFFTRDAQQDLNYVVDAPIGIFLPSVPSFSQILKPFNDWEHVGLPLRTVKGDAAAALEFPTDELTAEARDWIDANFPLPPGSCFADLDESGSVGTSDLLELFAQWGTPGSADFDESGAVGTSDLLILFANWGPC